MNRNKIQSINTLQMESFGLIKAVMALVVAFYGLSACKPKQETQLQQIYTKGYLNVVTRNNPTTYFQGPEGPAGIEYDLAQLFADHLGVELRTTVVENPSDILTLVREKKVDLAAAGLTITREREKLVRFGPSYQEIAQKLVFKQGNSWPRNIKQLDGTLRVTSHSSHSEQLLHLKEKMPALSWTETTELGTEELLSQVLDGDIDYTIVDSNELALNRRFYPELAIAFSITDPEPIAWAFSQSTDDSLLIAAVEFFGSLKTSGKLASLIDRYYGHVTKFDYVGTKEFLQAANSKLDKYVELFKQSAFKYDIDWRLLAAVSYQESHWNPKAKSPTGVRGMMMLTLPTAKQMKVKSRLDPVQSIEGGAKYLKKIMSRIPSDIQEPDRTWFALASYNVGWGHLEDARIITERQGANPDKWVDVKERLPLLRKKKYYKKTKYGYARGDEPVHYVTNIRRYYETLSWLHKTPNYDDIPDLDLMPNQLVAKTDNKEQVEKLKKAKSKKPESDKVAD